jgi:acyl-CoA reductase-like NAD-dependent aldehyde dehydrogenase
VIGSERDVRGGRLADGLAVLQLSATASIFIPSTTELTMYGLGAGVWTRDTGRAFRMGRASRPAASGRTATTSTPRTRPSAATRSRASGVRTTKMMLDHYTQTKCLLVSYDPKPLGLF